MTNKLKYLITTSVLLIISNLVNSKCIQSSDPCVCQFEDGRGYDLTSLTNEEPWKTLGNNNIQYAFLPCKNANLTFEGSNSTTCGSTSLCMFDKNISVDLGNRTELEWESSNNKATYLTFHHLNQTTKILLYCASIDSNLVFNKHIGLFFMSSKACPIMHPKHTPSSLSTGSVLVILLFVFSGIYLLAGALALRFFRGAVGVELIPNYDFWSQLPGLVRDGIKFTFNGCNVESYDQI